MGVEHTIFDHSKINLPQETQEKCEHAIVAEKLNEKQYYLRCTECFNLWYPSEDIEAERKRVLGEMIKGLETIEIIGTIKEGNKITRESIRKADILALINQFKNQ